MFLIALLGYTPGRMQASGVSAEVRATLPVQRADQGSLCVPRGYQNATLGIKLNQSLAEARIRLCIKDELWILVFLDAV